MLDNLNYIFIMRERDVLKFKTNDLVKNYTLPLHLLNMFVFT